MVQTLKEILINLFLKLSSQDNPIHIDIEVPEPMQEVIGIKFTNRNLIECVPLQST